VPLAAFAVLMLHPPLAERPRREPVTAPVPAVAEPSPSAVAPSVRIQHELVRLPKPASRPARPSAWRATRMALARPPGGRAPLIVRASRALVGDGRFKPEPFPRVTR
jgi:hypothetical protein